MSHKGRIRGQAVQNNNVSNVMGDLYNHAMSWVNRLDRQDWFLVFLGLVALGFLALQGFGSRKNY